MLLKDYMFCFHGTVKIDGEYIKERGIDLSKCRYATDFGQGFYVTNNVKQAEEWAIRKSKELKMLEVSNDISPVVIYFLLDYKKLEKLNGKDFSKATTQWGQFVLDCRLSGMNEQRFHEHDYVFGPLADGNQSLY